MTQTPYYGGNHHPPPLFVAELDSQPGRPSDAPSHHGPDGAPIFEMSGEPVLAQQTQSQTSDKNHSDVSSPPLQSPGITNATPLGESQDKPNKNSSTTSPSATANPWAYFGPEAPESTFKEVQTEDRLSEPVYKPYPGDSGTNPPEVPQSTRPPFGTSTPDLKSDDIVFYPAPLKLAHRPAKPASPPSFKPYAPPESQDISSLLPKPLNRPDRTSSQSPTTPSSYQPYRPQSPQSPSAAIPSSNTRPATTSLQDAPLASPPVVPQQKPAGSPSQHIHPISPPVPEANILPQPASILPTSPKPHFDPQPQPHYGIPNAAAVQQLPSSASTYLPSPITPSAQPASTIAPSPATPAPSVAFNQLQYATHVAVPGHAQTSIAGAGSPSPATSNNIGLPFAQPQYVAPVQTHNYVPNQSSTTPVTLPATASQVTVPITSNPAYNSSQSSPAQPSYNIPQPTYAPAPAGSTPGGANSSLPHPLAPYQQAAHTGTTAHHSHVQQPSAEPYNMPTPTQVPQSPPPPYAPQDTMPGMVAQALVSNNHTVYQPSPVTTYPPQHQYPPQPTYVPTMSPPLPDQPAHSLQPPALPPRPSSSQGFTPASGFGAGPAGYSSSHYPPPPQTYFSPPPALPARPGLGKLTGGGGKIFGSSSADKWLRKTGQVLESTLAPYLQGQSGPYRPGANVPQGQQGQPMQSFPGPYPSHAQYPHAPHLAPQFRGAPESGPPQHGPGALGRQ
ncbi:hypothetical protein NW752_002097 [Fusarium irregulare]|uniref:Uncharacterized protein n=1 Tax=Fusarium irregulare TaxID=2494466 RepID=A0A9W8PUW1_9HYPO|nr:hypothetical protein NW766_004268 [Fusarium irregulare]KAJ4027135.1 hypothetical protein NW752_002097 [Fusarium irregulare]